MGLSYAAFKFLPNYLCIKYHPLYNKDASDHIFERLQQQNYDNSIRHIVKLPMQEYYDAYAYYLMMEAYTRNSSKAVVDQTEQRDF